MPNQALIVGAGIEVLALGTIVDGFPSATHKLETTTGGEPVEQRQDDGRRSTVGATDHAVARPERLVLEGWASEFNGGDRPAQAWDALRRLHKAAQPTTVITEWGVYRNMIMRRCEAPQTARGLRFTIEFEEIIRVGVVDNQMPARNLQGPAAGRSGNVDRGRVQLESIGT